MGVFVPLLCCVLLFLPMKMHGDLAAIPDHVSVSQNLTLRTDHHAGADIDIGGFITTLRARPQRSLWLQFRRRRIRTRNAGAPCLLRHVGQKEPLHLWR